MSSGASLFNQRFKESVGLSSVTVDEDIVKAVAKLTELEREVGLLKKVLETANKTLNTQLPASKAQLVNVMAALADRIVGTAGPEATHFAQYKTVHKFMDEELPTKLNTAFEKAVIVPLDEWLKTFEEVRAEVKLTDEKRLVFDHYRGKVEGLRESKRKRQMGGKVIDKSTEEKLSRNEKKLADAEGEYHIQRDKTVGRLLYTFDDAAAHLSLVLLRVMQYELQVYKDSFTSVRVFEASAAELLSSHKDRRAAASAVGHMEACIRTAREMRTAGKPLDFDSLASAVDMARRAAGSRGPAPASPAAARRPTSDAGSSEWDDAAGKSGAAAQAIPPVSAPPAALPPAPAAATPVAKRSTSGNPFGTPGSGWGDTSASTAPTAGAHDDPAAVSTSSATASATGEFGARLRASFGSGTATSTQPEAAAPVATPAKPRSPTAAAPSWASAKGNPFGPSVPAATSTSAAEWDAFADPAPVPAPAAAPAATVPPPLPPRTNRPSGPTKAPATPTATNPGGFDPFGGASQTRPSGNPFGATAPVAASVTSGGNPFGSADPFATPAATAVPASSNPFGPAVTAPASSGAAAIKPLSMPAPSTAANRRRPTAAQASASAASAAAAAAAPTTAAPFDFGFGSTSSSAPPPTSSSTFSDAFSPATAASDATPDAWSVTRGAATTTALDTPAPDSDPNDPFAGLM